MPEKMNGFVGWKADGGSRSGASPMAGGGAGADGGVGFSSS